MSEPAAIAWDALRLRATAFRRWSERRGALALGLLLLCVASLLGGLADGARRADACLHRSPSGPAERQAAEALAGWLAYTPLPPDAQRELVRHAAAWLALRGELAALPRPLGHAAGCALAGLQRVAVAPYRRLALWLPYTLAVYAVARALGSQAGLPGMLAATCLYALPHLADPLRAAPGWGPLASVALFAWGIAIYLRAVAAAGGLDGPRALLAVLLPGLAGVTLAAILLSAMVVVVG